MKYLICLLAFAAVLSLSASAEAHGVSRFGFRSSRLGFHDSQRLRDIERLRAIERLERLERIERFERFNHGSRFQIRAPFFRFSF